MSTQPTFNGDWRSYATSDLDPILESALSCFVEHGYHGTTIRTVAQHAGLSVPGVYHHFPSKHSLLVGIVRYAMGGLTVRSVAALVEAGDSALNQLDSLVECFVLYHAHRSGLAFIASSEIRSLEESARIEHIAARDALQRMLDDIVDRGIAEGVFSAPFPRETSRAIVTMCTGVAQWYKAAGELSPEVFAARYVQIARAALSVCP